MRIVQIAGRSEQGMHRPFRCRAENDQWYYVKGASVGFHGLRAEWIAGRLAELLGLPIPPFEIVQIPAPLLAELVPADRADLGTGSCFASSQMPEASDFRYADLSEVADEMQLKILLFDWWICNIDRILGPQGGNPNLIWSEQPRELFLIDHNCAFSPDSELMKGFAANHVFASSFLWWQQYGKTLRAPMRAGCDELENLWQELPEDWTEYAEDFPCERMEEVLRRCEKKEFWKLERPQ